MPNLTHQCWVNFSPIQCPYCCTSSVAALCSDITALGPEDLSAVRTARCANLLSKRQLTSESFQPRSRGFSLACPFRRRAIPRTPPRLVQHPRDIPTLVLRSSSLQRPGGSPQRLAPHRRFRTPCRVLFCKAGRRETWSAGETAQCRGPTMVEDLGPPVRHNAKPRRKASDQTGYPVVRLQ
jgi:hypothetical protein